MNPLAKYTTPAWLAGAALAATGVLVVRLVAPNFEGDTRPLLQVAGELLAIGGLLLIAWGISRRARGAPPG